MKKVDLDQLFVHMRACGWEPGALNAASYRLLAGQGFQERTLMLAIVATELLAAGQPMTLRGLFYRVVSAGWLPSTDKGYYEQLKRLLRILRERELVPFEWIVDGVRATIKPSSWSGLQDFADTVRDAYRMDFWARLPHYVHIFCEKDAMAGTLEPVTRQYDVALSVIRGFASLSYVHEIAVQWRDIKKPIFAYYLGDFDPSGLDLERDVQKKLERYAKRSFSWERLGVTHADIVDLALLPLAPKKKDSRTKRFLSRGYTQCAELDAIPAGILRDRIEQAILSHVDRQKWEHLQQIEERERSLLHRVMTHFEEETDPYFHEEGTDIP